MSCRITVKSKDNTFVVTAKEGEVLADVLARAGLRVAADCGRRGVCSACSVKLTDGSFSCVTPDERGMIKSCRAKVKTDAVIEMNTDSSASDFTDLSGLKPDCNVAAVDVGTTTICVALLLTDGRVFTRSALNPQSAYGADVISRITACGNGHLDELKSLAMNCIEFLLSSLSSYGKPERITICGNPTMLHILCGVSPESMGKSPFIPSFTGVKSLEPIGGCEDVKTLPCVSAFIGSDVVSGIVSQMNNGSDTLLLADLGTNGELVLRHNGQYYCTSTAVGPALEGAGIECGVGGVDGAVSKVVRSPFGLEASTINSALPCGICGSGLVDCIAALLEMGVISPSGYMADEKYYLTKNVYLSRADVRAFQNAKSAVCSGVEVLCHNAGIEPRDIDGILLAGGTGWWINPLNAVKTGLLPEVSPAIVKAVGNSALKGALMCACSPEYIETAEKITKSCVVISLGGNEMFNTEFIENMNFGV